MNKNCLGGGEIPRPGNLIIGQWLLLFFGLIFGFCIGFAIYPYGNIWEEDGLDNLNNILRNDKTKRLAVVVLTEKQGYTILNIDRRHYEVKAAIVERRESV